MSKFPLKGSKGLAALSFFFFVLSTYLPPPSICTHHLQRKLHFTSQKERRENTDGESGANPYGLALNETGTQ